MSLGLGGPSRRLSDVENRAVDRLRAGGDPSWTPESGDREASGGGPSPTAVETSPGRVPRTTSMFGEDDMQAAFLAGAEMAFERQAHYTLTSDEQLDGLFWAWFDEYRGPVLP